MARVNKRIASVLIEEGPDRHANKLDIYKTSSGRYHLNFRNLQIRLSKAEFRLWVEGFTKAKQKLGERMSQDTFEPWNSE
jgi:hypothetical protein